MRTILISNSERRVKQARFLANSWVVVHSVCGWDVLSHPPISSDDCMELRSAGSVCWALTASTQTGCIWTEGGTLKVSQHRPAASSTLANQQSLGNLPLRSQPIRISQLRAQRSCFLDGNRARMRVWLRAGVWLVLIQHVYVTAICSYPSAWSNHIPVDLHRAETLMNTSNYLTWNGFPWICLIWFPERVKSCIKSVLCHMD